MILILNVHAYMIVDLSFGVLNAFCNSFFSFHLMLLSTIEIAALLSLEELLQMLDSLISAILSIISKIQKFHNVFLMYPVF